MHSPSPTTASSPDAPWVTSPVRLHEDQSLIVIGIGGFGRYVLHILSQELDRLRIPENRRFFVAFDEATSDPARRGPADYTVRLDDFDHDAYVASTGEELQGEMSHLPDGTLRDDRGVRNTLPGRGFVTFHRYDEAAITRHTAGLVDAARAANPTGRVKCIVVYGMGDGLAGGMAIPFLFRMQEHLRHNKVRLEVFLATSEAYRGVDDIPIRQLENNCVAHAMLWEHVLRGDEDLVYPDKPGVRESRRFRGPLPHRTWLFSAGSGSAHHPYPVVASIVANCITTLELTRLGSYLDGDRVHYGEDLLERHWTGPQGVPHPTSLLTMNVAGLKADSLPALYHLRTARDFVDTVTQALSESAESHVRETAMGGLVDTGICDPDLLEELEVGRDALTHEVIDAHRPGDTEAYEFVRERLDRDLGVLYALADGSAMPDKTEDVVQRAQIAIANHARRIAGRANGYLPGAVLYYRTAQQHLETQKQQCAQRLEQARRELADSRDRQRLERLLERLQKDTRCDPDHKPNMFERFVSTISVSVQTQVRKIVEVTNSVRELAYVAGSSGILTTVYERLARFCEAECESLQNTAYALNNVMARCAREEEMLQRVSRGAFVYQKARFGVLVERLTTRLGNELGKPDATEVVDRLGGLVDLGSNDAAMFRRVMDAVRPDARQLADAADRLMTHEPLVTDAVKESLTQFVATVRFDRERFRGLETARSRYVLCTKAMYETHRDLFDGYHHLETDNPYNVLFTQHQEGLPFLAIAYMGEIASRYRDEPPEVRAQAHAQASFVASLPALDA